MTRTTASTPATYGTDAPYIPIGYLIVGALLLMWAVASQCVLTLPATWAYVLAALAFAGTGWFLYVTWRGKFVVWRRLLDDLRLNGDETVLDMGCGRGAVLLAVARRIPGGRVYGADLWLSRDQSGNDPETTRRNARTEGLEDRIDLRTADLRSLPFDSESFDVVVSSLAVHNIPGTADRARAIDEAVRVLRPGGRLVIVDLKPAREYEKQLTRLGLRDVRRRDLGPRMWWSGPWMPTYVVTAVRD